MQVPSPLEKKMRVMSKTVPVIALTEKERKNAHNIATRIAEGSKTKSGRVIFKPVPGFKIKTRSRIGLPGFEILRTR